VRRGARAGRARGAPRDGVVGWPLRRLVLSVPQKNAAATAGTYQTDQTAGGAGGRRTRRAGSSNRSFRRRVRAAGSPGPPHPPWTAGISLLRAASQGGGRWRDCDQHTNQCCRASPVASIFGAHLPRVLWLEVGSLHE
jgi:hypothetical protein